MGNNGQADETATPVGDSAAQPTSSAARWVDLALSHRRLPVVLALLSSLLLLPAVWSGFQLDDHFQRFRLLGHGDPSIQLFVFNDGDPERNARMMDTGRLPWWTTPTFRHASFRYLSVVTMQLDYLLWPDRPALMHLHSLLWLALLVAAATLLYRQIMGPAWLAGLAALLYAVDDAHSIPAAYLANRNAVIAAGFGVLSLLSFAHWRRDGWRTGAFLSPGFLALALAAGEIALATAAYLASYALFLDRGGLWARLKALVPHGVVLLLWAAIYKLGRFGSEGSGFYTDPLGDPVGFALAFAERAPFLLLGQWTPIPSDLALASGAGIEGLFELSLIVAGLLALLLFPIVRRDPAARFWCLGALLSLLPIAATGPQNRLLIFVGIGSMGLLAQLMQALVSGVPRSRWWRVPAWGAAALLLVSHLVVAPPLGLAFVDFQVSATRAMVRAIASVPHDERVAEQDLILVNPPEFTYPVGAIPVVKRVAGLPAPRRIRTLSAGISVVTVERLDSRTLSIHLADGLFPDPFTRYFRSKEHGFLDGQRFQIEGLSVEVQALNEDGDPQLIVYRFDVPLEDPSLRWLRWKEGVYEPWSPPVAGQSVELAPSGGLFYEVN